MNKFSIIFLFCGKFIFTLYSFYIYILNLLKIVNNAIYHNHDDII